MSTLCFRVLNNCGIIGDVRNNYSVKISKCGGGAFNLLIEGTKSHIHAAKKALTKELEVFAANNIQKSFNFSHVIFRLVKMNSLLSKKKS